jgi:tetratricopeptide (TPR) repeat protein
MSFSPTSMSSIWHIGVNIFFLVVIVGFAIWVLFRLLRRSPDAGKLIFKWVFTAVMMGLMFFVVVPGFKQGGFDAIAAIGMAGIWGVIMAITWRHALIDLVANPIASLYDGGKEEVEPKPFYSIANSKRKTNKPLEAIVEIRKQLAKFPNDYEGVALLAIIQAEDLKDLSSAEITFNHFCDRSDAPPKQVAAALTQLADWHLKIAQDADSARAVLEKIIARFPETALALQAAQRIAHLGGTEKILRAAHDRQSVFLPAGIQNIGLLDSTAFLRPAETDPEKQAADYVRHLEQHPQDTKARENLAIIYARHYQRLDLAAQELEQLINEPNQPGKSVAYWLNLLADLQIHGGADYDTARATLEKIVERFPGLSAGEIARSRLGRLKLEIKGKTETPGKKLGVYEQNIGLKHGAPRQP